MIKNLDEYLKEPYTRILIPNEDGSYSAEILEFPGCFAEGETANDAMQNLDDAAKSWIEATISQGHDVPEPFMNQDFGGKIALRLPRSLHRRASQMAERDRVSLNQFLVSAIAEKLGAEDLIVHLMDKYEQRLSPMVHIVNFTQFDTITGGQRVLFQPSSQLKFVSLDENQIAQVNLPAPTEIRGTTVK